MLKIIIVIIAVMALGALFSGCLTSSGVSNLETVAHVDLGRYIGTWHEIARYPNSFQKGCIWSTATYTLRALKPGKGAVRIVAETERLYPMPLVGGLAGYTVRR